MRVDALVIGGGIQGLLALRALVEAGYEALLVTAAPLGAGQTLHAHGLLDSGTGLMTGQTRQELDEHVLPDLHRLGVPVVRDRPSYVALPPAALQQLAPVWADHGHRPEPVADGAAPPGLVLPRPLHRVVAHHVWKPALVAGVAAGLHERIARGRLVSFGDPCSLELAGHGRLELQASVVVIAAGCGSPALLAQVVGAGAGTAARLGHVRTHMLCLRAPAGVLPRVGTVLTPTLGIVAHEDGDGGSRWYVTPQHGEPQRVALAPDDGVAAVDESVVAAGVGELRRLVPVLAEENPQVELAVYAGYKQDVDGDMTRRLVELLPGEPPVLLAAPSVYAGAWANAREVVDRVRTLAVPRARRVQLPAGLAGVEPGHESERDASVTWRPWRDVTRS